MSWKPSIIAFDFETALWNFSPSVEYYRHDFEVISCAFAWRDQEGILKSKCLFGEDAVRKELGRISDARIPTVVHNKAFELGCILCRFPEYKHIPMYDTMRLCQLTDNGGEEFVKEFERQFEDILSELEGKKPINGLSLEACVSRLGDKERYRHKEPFKKLMRERGGSDKSYDLLTRRELAEYNKLDAEVTLDLYERVTKILKNRGIDWGLDHKLYTSRCTLTAQSKIRGVLTDGVQIDKCIKDMGQELINIEERFRERFAKEIAEIEQEMIDQSLATYKTERGREAGRVKLMANPPKFNLNSSPQKAYLLTEKLGLVPRFYTKGKRPQPSLDAKLLWQYGEAGTYLENIGKIRIGLKQDQNLKELAEYDQRYHIDIKCAAAKTGRLGGGKDE